VINSKYDIVSHTVSELSQLIV